MKAKLQSMYVGMDYCVITDHNTVNGAQAAARLEAALEKADLAGLLRASPATAVKLADLK